MYDSAGLVKIDTVLGDGIKLFEPYLLYGEDNFMNINKGMCNFYRPD